MGIKHAAVKATGDRGLASEWNANHVIDDDVDVANFQLLSAALENRTTWPAGPVAGQIIYRTDLATAYVWNGTAWVALSAVTRSATKIVAANDSLDKLRADYVCDGTADNVQIQDAINALPATGGRVLLLDGTYNIALADFTSSITINKPGVTLQGQGRNTKLAWTDYMSLFPCVIKVAGVVDVTICDIGLVVTDAGPPALASFFIRTDNGSHNLEVRNITATGLTMQVYTAATCNYMRFSNWSCGAMVVAMDIYNGARCSITEMRGTAFSIYADSVLTKSHIANNNVYRISMDFTSTFNYVHDNITNILTPGGATNVFADNQTGW